MPVEIDMSKLKSETREKLKDYLERKLSISLEAKGDRLVFSEPSKISKTKIRKTCRWFVGKENLKNEYKVISSEERVVIWRKS